MLRLDCGPTSRCGEKVLNLTLIKKYSSTLLIQWIYGLMTALTLFDNFFRCDEWVTAAIAHLRTRLGEKSSTRSGVSSEMHRLSNSLDNSRKSSKGTSMNNLVMGL